VSSSSFVHCHGNKTLLWQFNCDDLRAVIPGV
jgi:hypothetical protein